MERYLPFLLIACGLFSIICALKDWDWFMNHHKARFMAKLLGRTGARAFYVVLGLAICGGGIVFLITGIPAK